MQIIIPMAGIGQRFIDDGYSTPKPLIKVDGIPMIQHVVNLFDIEDDQFIFICNETHMKNTNMETVLYSIVDNPEIKTLNIPTSGAVESISYFFDSINDDDEVIVSYCDFGTQWDYKSFLKEIYKSKSDGAIVCYKGFHPHMLGTDNYAFVKMDENNKYVVAIQEKKPFTDNRMDEYASNGIYYFKSGKIFKHYCKKLLESKQTVNNEFYVSLVYNLMVQDGLNISVYEIDKMLQWGTPFDLNSYQYWSDYFKRMINRPVIYPDDLNTTLILPMAGRGSRFSSEGYEYPKPLLPINNKPMFVQAVKCLPDTTNKIFIHLTEHDNNYFQLTKEIEKWFPKAYSVGIDEVTSGQAITCDIGISSMKVSPESPILISACDNGVTFNPGKYNRMLHDESVDVIVWGFRNNPTTKHNPNAYAWLTVDDEGFIENVSCKKLPNGADPLKTFAILGTMFFRKAKYFSDGLKRNRDYRETTNGEYYVDDVINRAIGAGLNVKLFPVEDYICWGTPNDYKTYRYWQEFFDQCSWHPYSIEKDISAH